MDMTTPFDLSGQTAIVTGANTGIGQAIALSLAAAGADWHNVVKLTVYLTDMSYQNELNTKTHSIFGKENPPPRTLIGVSCLSHEDMLVEIDATACI